MRRVRSARVAELSLGVIVVALGVSAIASLVATRRRAASAAAAAADET
jgi:hypothetical protein